MSNEITMNRETKYNLILAGWFLAIFLAIAGVSTWYSTNPTIIGLIVAVVLMLGFLFSLKAASAFLFDNDNDFKLRTASLIILIGLVAVDVFSGSHSLQTGTMKRVVGETQNSATYTAALNNVNSIQQQLNDCPPKYFKNCKLPLSEQLQTAQKQLQAAANSGTGSAEAKFWMAMTNAINSMTENKVAMEDVVFYTYVMIMLLASIISIYAFGILGTGKEKAAENSVAVPETATSPVQPAKKQPETAKNSQKQPKEQRQGFGFIKQPATPATAKTNDDYTLHPRNNLNHAYAAPTISPDRIKLNLPKERANNEPSGIGFLANIKSANTTEKANERTNTASYTAPTHVDKAIEVNLTEEKQAKLAELQRLKEKAAQQAQLLAQRKQMEEKRQQQAAEKAEQEKREAVYQNFKKALKAELSPTIRPTKRFISENIDGLNIKSIQELSDEFLERAAKEGVISHNPEYKKGNKKSKYLKV